MKNSVNIILSVACFVFFSVLVYLSYKHFSFANIFEGVLEFITIPLVGLTVFLIYFNLRQWRSEKWNKTSFIQYPTYFSLATVAVIIIATIFNI